MDEFGEKAKRIGLPILWIITIISAVVGFFVVYQIINVKKPWTITTVYADTLEYSGDGGSPWIISVKQYTNKNNNGKKVTEIQFNSYADAEGQSIAGFGIQCVGDFEVHNCSTSELKWNDLLTSSFYCGDFTTWGKGNFTFYSTGDKGQTYNVIPYNDTALKDYLLIDVNGEFYKLTLKEYKYKAEVDVASLKSSKLGALDFFKALFGKAYETRTARYTWYDVFDYIANSTASNLTDENKVYALNLFDLAPYLTIEKQVNKQYVEVDKTSENLVLFQIPIENSLDGLTKAEDSKFGMVSGNPFYNQYTENAKDFWRAETDITINENHLNKVYYKSYDKNFLTIDRKFANYLLTRDVEINIVIDIKDSTIKGIDLANFDFKISSFTIKNAGDDFQILNQNKCKVVPVLEGRV